MSPARVARAVAAITVALRLARGVRGHAAVEDRADDGSTAPPPSISVVIPARNEAEQIARAVRSATAAAGVVEVVVVDDESSDATADVAAAAGARVVDVRVRPVAWAGKSWAVQCGVEAASGEWVVTIDADVTVDESAPAALVARSVRDGADLVSIAGRFARSRPSAQWLHAAMLATLVYRFGPPGVSHRGGRELSNGQCTAFRRKSFLAWGGFEPVAGSPVEDVALARHLASAGRRVRFLDGTSIVTVAPYATFRSTWRGWGRSLGLPGVDADLRRAVDVVTLALTLVVPPARLARGRFDLIDAVTWSMRLGTLVGMRRAYEHAGPGYWLSPLADPVALGAVIIGGFRRTQSWKGRRYETPGGPARTGPRSTS